MNRLKQYLESIADQYPLRFVKNSILYTQIATNLVTLGDDILDAPATAENVVKFANAMVTDAFFSKEKVKLIEEFGEDDAACKHAISLLKRLAAAHKAKMFLIASDLHLIYKNKSLHEGAVMASKISGYHPLCILKPNTVWDLILATPLFFVEINKDISKETS
jgi:hypothetical protein